MKKVFAIFIAVLGFSTIMAQSTEVPTRVQMAFKNTYKSTVVQWATSSQSYIAKWESNGKQMTAYYTKGDPSTLVRTETDVPLTDLSLSAQTSVKDRFLTQGSQYSFSRSFKVEGFEGVTEGCEFSLQNGSVTSKLSVFYDAAGNMVKRELN
jgi:hypothetical protein